MTPRLCPKCGQGWVKLKAAEPDICPTCRIGLGPLSTLRGESKPTPKPLDS